MKNLTESHIRKIIREVLLESLILEISAEEKASAYAKSNERVPFSADLMKQAIEQGREIGINFRSKNDKYEMPVTKARIIHPVAMGTDKNGNIIVRGLHITGQSEKAAIQTGIRSAEVEAEKDGIDAWRLFKVSNLKSMWFTGNFFSNNIPGYNPSDSAMTTRMATYNPESARVYQGGLAKQKPTVQTQPEKQVPVDRDIEQMGYSDQPAKEKNKDIRRFFK